MAEAKTVTVSGSKVGAKDHAYVGDANDTSTWKLPIHDCAHAKNALSRFNQTQGIPASEREKVARKIVAKAKSCGFDTSGFEKEHLGKKSTKNMDLPMLFRAVTIELDEYRARGADSKDDRIPVSLSSDTPVERYFGNEILDHSKGAVDLSRAKNGLPLLLDHDTRAHVGRLEDVQTDGKKLRAMMRFSQRPEAQAAKQDVLDGIRCDASLGYRVREMQLESADEKDGNTYRATNWMPYEGSLVAVPADHTVGVGRSAEGAAEEPVTVIAPTPAAPAAKETRTMPETQVTGGEELARAERERTKSIRKAFNEYRELAGLKEEQLDSWLEKGSSEDQVRQDILTAIEEKAKHAPAVSAGDGGLGISPKEKRPFSVVRAIRAAADGNWKDAGYEKAVSDALTKRFGNHSSEGIGFQMPMDAGWETRAGLDSKTTSAGLELKFVEPGSFIELLRNSTKVMGLGATFLSGLQGNVAFPRQLAAGTFSWVAENPGSDVSDSNLTLQQVTMSPKIGQSSSSYSRNLLTQAVVDVEQLVRQDLALITAIAIDAAAINGSGSSNQPTGVLNQSGVGSVTLGANGGTVSWATIINLVKTVEIANALRGKLGWLTTPQQRAQLKQLAQISATTGIPIWWNGEVDGYRADSSTNVPSNLTKGTSTTICSAIIFGNWAELIIGQWNALEIIVDPYRLKKQGMIEITSYAAVDIAVRHGPSFAACVDAL